MARTKKKVEEESPRKKCIGCGKEKRISVDFYSSRNNLHQNKIDLGKSRCCKECSNSQLFEDGKPSRNRLIEMLKDLNIIFYQEAYIKTVMRDDIKPQNFFSKYINTLNLSYKAFKDNTFDLSVFECNLDKLNKVEVNETKEMIDELITGDNSPQYSKEWRGTYTQGDIEYLDSYYKDLNRDYKIITRNHEDYARKIAKVSLAMDKAYDDMVQGDEDAIKKYKDLKDAFDKLCQSAKFSENTRSQNDMSLGCFGVVFDRVEQHMWVNQHIPIAEDDIDKMISAFTSIKKSI